jgi:hypothetical protein
MSRLCWGMAISDSQYQRKEGERGEEGRHGGWERRPEQKREVRRDGEREAQR